MIRNFTLTNALGASFSLMNARQGAFFEPQGLGYDDVTQYEQVGEFFAPLTQRYGQQVVTGTMVFGSQPYEHYLAFTKFCQHAPLSLVYETDAGTFQIPCRLTKIEKGDTDGWTYLNCKVEFTALARMYKTVVANNTGTAGGGKIYSEKELPDITGSIITIDNAEAGEVLNITADIEAVQSGSGTPSIDNVRPISGHDEVEVGVVGKNLLAKPFSFRPVPSTLADCFFIKKGTYTFSFDSIGTATSWRFGVSLFDSDGNALNDNAHKPNAVMNYVSSVAMWWWGDDINIKSFTISIVEDCYTRIWFGSGNTDNTMTATNAMLNIGNTAFPYEPYNGTTYTTTLPSTTYGGTLDLVSGELTVTHTLIDGGSKNWTYLYGNNFYTTVSGKSADSVTDIKCEIFATTTGGTGQDADGVFNQVALESQLENIYIKDSTVSADSAGATALKAKLNGYKIWYRLATPTTTTLTPQQIQTLLGQNNVWANSGDITITGRKTYEYKYNYTYGDFVADTVTIDSDSTTSSPCRITIFGECTQPTWRHYLDGNSVATGYYNGTIPSGHKLVIDTTSSPYSIEEQDIAGNLIADRYELCDFSTERFFLLEYGHNTISVSHTDPDSIRLMVEGYIFYETV